MPHCLIIWRVSGRGVFRRRVHQTPVGWHDHVDRIRPICEQNDGSKEPTPLEGAEKSDEPEDAANDDEACLHDVASLVGRLPLGEKRAIVKLEARRLLSDVDVDRSSRKRSGECEREVPDKHLPPPVFTTSLPTSRAEDCLVAEGCAAIWPGRLQRLRSGRSGQTEPNTSSPSTPTLHRR